MIQLHTKQGVRLSSKEEEASILELTKRMKSQREKDIDWLIAVAKKEGLL